MNMHERRAIKLPWDEVCEIISSEIARVVGVQIQCKASVAENLFWAVEFTDRHLSLPEYCCLMQSLQPALEDWEDALPDEIGPDIKDMGPYVGEKIIAQRLNLSWEHSLITDDGLWLIGVTETGSPQSAPDGGPCGMIGDVVQVLMAIADHLHQQEGGK